MTALVTVRPGERRARSKPKAIVGYAATLRQVGDRLELVCDKKSWHRVVLENSDEIQPTTVETKSLWFAANIGTRMILQPRDIEIDGCGVYKVTAVVEKGWTTLVIAGSGCPCGAVVAFKIARRR